MPTPRLRMGLIGFTDAEYPLALLGTRAVVPWERAIAAEADALWIAGEAARWDEGDLVRIRAAAGEPETVLQLKALDRPTAFTLPLADERLKPALTVDLRSAASVVRVMRRIETVLQPLVMQLALATEIANRLVSLTSDTYHLTRAGKLLAVVNVPGAVGIDAECTPADLARAKWTGLPRAAGTLPATFLATTFAECLWQYVTRTEADLLPHRYRHAPLYFRAIPRVPQRLIRDVHYAVLAELSSEPQDFARLQQTVGIAEAPLAAALAVLYFSGSITTDRSRAAKGGALRVPGSSSPGELRESTFPPDSTWSRPFGTPANTDGDTLALPLDHRRKR